MANVKAGVVTAVEVNGPIANPSSGKLIDKNSASTWATVLFVISIVMLFVVL
jgi:hypothetical protein